MIQFTLTLPKYYFCQILNNNKTYLLNYNFIFRLDICINYNNEVIKKQLKSPYLHLTYKQNLNMTFHCTL